MSKLTILAVLLCAWGCDSNSPMQPTQTALTINASTPAPGSIVVIPMQYPYIVPGGVAFPPGSGLLSVSVVMSSGHNVPWAELNVYLLTGGASDQYCGQNTPDAPTWQFLPPGWTATYTVTGFRVSTLPCDVTGFRAMLHMRNNGLLTPPTSAETIAEATISTNIHLMLSNP